MAIVFNTLITQFDGWEFWLISCLWHQWSSANNEINKGHTNKTSSCLDLIESSYAKKSLQFAHTVLTLWLVLYELVLNNNFCPNHINFRLIPIIRIIILVIMVMIITVTRKTLYKTVTIPELYNYAKRNVGPYVRVWKHLKSSSMARLLSSHYVIQYFTLISQMRMFLLLMTDRYLSQNPNMGAHASELGIDFDDIEVRWNIKCFGTTIYKILVWYFIYCLTTCSSRWCYSCCVRIHHDSNLHHLTFLSDSTSCPESDSLYCMVKVFVIRVCK